jgi:8-oxo-dGTP pyrophosphatase MutT (NUDIX family)
LSSRWSTGGATAELGEELPSREYAVTVCVLLNRNGGWLLSVRSPDAGYAPGRLGLIGGHVEVDTPTLNVLEATARREVAEETGLDLTAIPLTYFESEFFVTDRGERQVTVTFVAPAPAGAAAAVAAPAEVSEVGWWTRDEVAADPRCPEWLPDLLDRAAAALP